MDIDNKKMKLRPLEQHIIEIYTEYLQQFPNYAYKNHNDQNVQQLHSK